MSSVSLKAAIKGYTVPSSAAAVLSTSRDINPNNITCYNWDGTDPSGRAANVNSVSTRSAGCNTANETILPESALRPNYIAMVLGGGSAIEGTLDLPKSNPMYLPGLQRPGEHFMPSFGFTMPVKVIPGQQPASENFASWGSPMQSALRPSAEHFGSLNSYTLADRQMAEEKYTPYSGVFGQAGTFKLESFIPKALMLHKGEENFSTNLYKKQERWGQTNMQKLTSSRAFTGVA